MLLAINPTSTLPPPISCLYQNPSRRSSKPKQVSDNLSVPPTKGKQQTVKRFSNEDQIHK